MYITPLRIQTAFSSSEGQLLINSQELFAGNCRNILGLFFHWKKKLIGKVKLWTRNVKTEEHVFFFFFQ